jgi:hypothetical protein
MLHQRGDSDEPTAVGNDHHVQFVEIGEGRGEIEESAVSGFGRPGRLRCNSSIEKMLRSTPRDYPL